MEDYFLHCDDVEPFLFTLLKVEDDGIVDLSKIFKEEIEHSLIWALSPIV